MYATFAVAERKPEKKSGLYWNLTHYFIFILHKLITNRQNDQLPVGLLAQLGRARRQYREGHGLQSCTSQNFCQVFFLQLG